MGETLLHAALVHYLMEVLTWLFHGRACAIYENFNFYQTPHKKEKPLAPDVAVIKGITHRPVRSWRIGTHGSAPHVVFEIASEETWKRDLEEKPELYARMGVQEYFAYDPNDPPIHARESSRLFGWQLDRDTGLMQKIVPSPSGRLWSQHLNSLLVPDDSYLRLHDREGRLRLTKDEADVLARQAAERRAEAEAQSRRFAEKRAQAAERRAQAEAEKNRILVEKLRALGIDPEQLL